MAWPPVRSVASPCPCSPWYGLLGCLEDAFVPLLDNMVLIPALDSNILGKFICSNSKDTPLCLFVIPSWLRNIYWNDLGFYSEEHWFVINSAKLLSHLSLDTSIDVF